MRNNRIHITATSWVIAMAIFYYFVAANIVGFTHEHEHGSSGSHDCSACFFSANHLGIAFHAVDLPNLDSCSSIHSPFDPAFLAAAPVNNVRSRAPPASTA